MASADRSVASADPRPAASHRLLEQSAGAAGLHIGYLVQQFPPEVGAGPARVAEMASRWIAAGARVTIFTGMPNRPQGRVHPDYRGKVWLEEHYRGMRVLRSWLFTSPRRGFMTTLLNNLTFMASAGIAAALRGSALDVLIASEPPFFPHVAGVFAARLRRVPLVLEVRDLWPDYIVQMGVLRTPAAVRALYGLERALLRRAHRVVVVTESFRRRMIEKGVPDLRIQLVPNGVDTCAYFSAKEPAPFPELKHVDGEFVVGYLGNMGAGQSLTAILDAAAILAAEDPAIRIVLAGDGPERDAVLRRAQDLRLPNVTIHGTIPKEQTRAFYNACDACLVPLAPIPVFQETVPSKLFEIMACEKPVVLCAAGEARAIVQSCGCGVVADPGDPKDIAAGVKRIRALTAAERATMGRAGRAYACDHHDRDTLAARYLSILHELSSSRRDSTPVGAH